MAGESAIRRGSWKAHNRKGSFPFRWGIEWMGAKGAETGGGG